MTTIRLEIFPSFDPSCYLQLDRQTSWCDLTVEINFADKNKWHIRIEGSESTNAIEYLAKKVVIEAVKDTRIILDGVSLKCSVMEEGNSEQHKFRCPEPGTIELKLVTDFLAIAQKYIPGQSFINYIELIEGYFANNLPVKIFEETPLRLRIYGSLTIHEKEGLAVIINSLSGRNEVIIDMSNFVSMGTVLYECLKPLKNIPKILFLANKNALKHIEAMEFDKKQVKVVD